MNSFYPSRGSEGGNEGVRASFHSGEILTDVACSRMQGVEQCRQRQLTPLKIYSINKSKKIGEEEREYQTQSWRAG